MVKLEYLDPEGFQSLRRGDVIHVESKSSLVEEPIRIRVEDIIENGIVGRLLTPDGRETDTRVVLKRSYMEGDTPYIPIVFPHNILAVEKAESGHHNIVQLHEGGDPDPEELGKIMAYINALNIIFGGNPIIHDIREGNVGRRPYDALLTYRDSSELGKYIVWVIAEAISLGRKFGSEEKRKKFMESLRKHLEKFLQNMEEIERFEIEQRKKILEKLRKHGYTPRRTMRIV